MSRSAMPRSEHLHEPGKPHEMWRRQMRALQLRPDVCLQRRARVDLGAAEAASARLLVRSKPTAYGRATLVGSAGPGRGPSHRNPKRKRGRYQCMVRPSLTLRVRNAGYYFHDVAHIFTPRSAGQAKATSYGRGRLLPESRRFAVVPAVPAKSSRYTEIVP